MIKSKQDLIDCIKQDAIASYRDSVKPKLLGDDIWKFQLTMRKLEYYSNLSGFRGKITLPLKGFYRYLFHKRSIRLGFSIAYNVFDKGFSIAHYGTVVVNPNVRAGRNCRIHAGVNIGATNGSVKAPVLGDNVYIGPGVKIIGDISIADDVCLGAGAVVVKSITEKGTTWGGVPARKISDHNSHQNLNPRLFPEDNE